LKQAALWKRSQGYLDNYRYPCWT